MTPLELRDFQAKHTDWEGKRLDVDGALGPRTQWALDVARLESWRQAIIARATGTVGVSIYAGLGAVEFAAEVYDRGRKLVRRLAPSQPEESHPLSWKDIEHQQEQIRRATMRPPPKHRSAACAR